MRADQLQRLQDLTEELADAFLLEADPREWPGAGKAPADMEQDERGNRYWCKKNAMATGGVLRYTLDLVEKHSADDPEANGRDADLDKQLREAEKRAAAAMHRVLDPLQKKAFDKAVHGRKG